MRAVGLRAAAVACVVGAVVVGACGPSRDATRENVIEDLSSYGSVDEDCVGSVLDKYSDEELSAIDREARALTDPANTSPTATVSEAFRDLYDQLFACVTITT